MYNNVNYYMLMINDILPLDMLVLTYLVCSQ